MGRKKGSRNKKKSGTRKRLSGAKKYAIVKVYQAGVPASRLAQEFKVAIPSIYLWDRQVKKAKGKNPFNAGSETGLSPAQKRLLATARRTK